MPKIKFYITAAMFALTLIGNANASMSPLTVVESTPERLVVIFEMTGFDTLTTVNRNNTVKTRLVFDHGFAITGDSGQPFIPGYAIFAGVPQNARENPPRITVEPIELATVSLRHPIETVDHPRDPLDPVFSSRWVSDPAFENLREHLAARIVLRPINPVGERRVQLLKKARVIIEFPNAPHTRGRLISPRDDYERMISQLLVNYQVAQGWIDRERPRLSRAAEDGGNILLSPNTRFARFRVGDGHRGGNEGTTHENSIIRISGRRVREIFGAGQSINSVALYASHKGELDVSVPFFGAIPDGIYEVPMMRFDVNGNGIVDDDDYFLAYVSGSSDWTYNSGTGRFEFSINRFDDRRTYAVVIKNGAQTMPQFENAPAAAPAQTTFENNHYVRQPRFLLHNPSNLSVSPEGGIDWGMRLFTHQRPDTTLIVPLPGIDLSLAGSVRLVNGSIFNASGGSHIDMTINQNTICTFCTSVFNPIRDWGSIAETDPSANITLRYRSTTSHLRSYHELNAVHLRYARRLELTDDAGKLEIFSNTANGTFRYQLTKSGSDSGYVFRVPVDDREVSFVGKIGGAESVFEWSDEGNTGVRYMAMLTRQIVDYGDSLTVIEPRRPVDAALQIRDLRNVSNQTDYLIIAHSDFLNAALNLARHKNGTSNFSDAKVVLVEDILDQFGGGNTDPAAIRNFIHYMYGFWQSGGSFAYITLLGSGHYDYKQVTTTAPIFVPIPYIDHRISDDFYTFLNTATHPSAQHSGYYYIGRIPAKSAVAAQDMVDKIIELEDPAYADFGPWRNRVLFSADDDQQGASPDAITNHHISSALGSERIEMSSPHIDLRKLYLYEFEWDERYMKPGAARAFINEINSGVAFVSWFGHGSMNQFADEAIFTQRDVSALQNRARYPIFALFSCSQGKFDQPNAESIAELLVRQPRAGAAATVAAAREVFANRNHNLARPFFQTMFPGHTSQSPTVGFALRTAKHQYNQSGAADNRYFIILGDPSLRVTNRGRDVSLSIFDSEGNELDALKALQRVTVRGEVRDLQSGERDETFGGAGANAFITLFNPPQYNVLRKDGGTFTNPRYTLPGTPVFSGRVNVSNGQFEQTLLLPMNLTFGQRGVRLTAYVWNEGTDDVGAGHIGNLIFEGSEVGDGSDTLGPRISVRPLYENAAMDQAGLFVRNRITAALPLTIEVLVEDASGINLIGDGPDEGLTAEVRGSMSRRSISHEFRFAEGSFSRGTATITFPENSMRGGRHELVISAQDLLGNVSKQSITLDITDPSELRLDHVTNIPNPVRMGRYTQFFYHHSDVPGDFASRVTIRVYTLGGRLISVINDPPNGYRWRPADQHGNLLTPNVYLYQVTIDSRGFGGGRGTRGGGVTSRVKKLVVHPP